MNVFAACKAAGRAAFIPYFMAGDPPGVASVELAIAAVDSGADIVELGIPYSDPIADGASIQAASQRALARGMTFDAALGLASTIASRIAPVPLVAFSYYNPIFVRGVERAATQLRSAGLAGAVIPDLPTDEAEALLTAFRRERLSAIFLVAPTTPLQRAGAIARHCTDFVYVVSRMGVTGVDRAPIDSIRERVQRLRTVTAKPLAVGFGVATPEQALGIAQVADGVVVGSALVDRIAAARSLRAATRSVREFCRAYSAVMQRSRSDGRRG